MFDYSSIAMRKAFVRTTAAEDWFALALAAMLALCKTGWSQLAWKMIDCFTLEWSKVALAGSSTRITVASRAATGHP